jgi:hypothetical protein
MNYYERRALQTSLIAFAAIIVECPPGYNKLKNNCVNAIERIREVAEMEAAATKTLRELREAGCILPEGESY